MPIMLTRLLAAGLLLLCLTPLSAQTPTFQQVLSDSSDTRSYWVTPLPDGYLIAGSTAYGNNSSSDGYLIRTDLNGAIIWQHRYDSYGTDELRAVCPANDGGFLAIGSASGAGAGVSNTWILRLDDNGNLLWNKTIGQSGHLTVANYIVPIGDGYIISGVRINNVISTARGFVTRIDNDGTTVWSKIPFSNRYNWLSAQFVRDGVIYGCGDGYAELFAERVEGVWFTMNLETGELINSYRCFSQEWETINSIRPAEDGNLVMAGWTQPNSLLIAQPSYAWVQKVTPDGTVLWSKTYRIPMWVHSWPQLENDDDGGFIMSIYLNYLNTGLSLEFDESATLIKLDTDGQPVWNRKFSGGQFSHFQKVVKAADGGFAAIGGVKNAPLDPYDGFFVKTDATGNMESCCSSQWPTLDIADLVDTVMVYDPAPVNFVESRSEPEPMVDAAYFSATDVCLHTPVHIQETIQFCPGQSVTLGGVTYDQPGTVELSLGSNTEECDTLATYVLEWLPQVSLNDTIRFCPGATVTLQGNTYSQPGVVQLNLPGSAAACDTLATYVLEWLPQVSLNDTIRFCPGETVSVHGIEYTQPGEISLVLPGAGGACDTLAAYVLEYLSDNQPNTVSLTCPANISVAAAPGSTIATVNYTQPVADTDCPCPGLSTTLVSGGASGSAFPLGTSTVCYRADDACGHSASCCFTVEVQSVEDACDTKISGCIKFELLGVQRDGALNWVYRVRVTNNCSAELQYVYLQVPDGLTAFSPANNAIYTAPSGRSYLARNPNYSPMYSVRFKSQGTGIAGGESDVFRYALPQQADVDYINVGVRLSSGLYYETHLNTFGCPVTTELNPRPAAERQYSPANGAWRVYPNPAAPGALLHLEGPALDNAVFALRDAAGRLVWEGPVTDQSVSLGDAALPGGVYGFRITSNGQWVSSGKLVVLR